MSLLKNIPQLIKRSSFAGSLPEVEQSWEIQESDLIFGEPIASGSYGTVYKGTYIGTDVAIKKIFRDRMEEEDMKKFLERELAASKFSHPNLVGFIGIAENLSDNCIYLVTELMNTSLHAILRDPSDPLPWLRRVRLLSSGAKALGYLHAKNIMHRDIKSKNMLLDESGKLKLCDFGFARKVVRGRKGAMTICGTDEYMAPEVILGDPYDNLADVFSFGVVMCEVIVRKSIKKNFPREPRNLFGFDFEKFQEMLPNDCPKALADLCIKCLATESEERPSFPAIITTLVELEKDLFTLLSASSTNLALAVESPTHNGGSSYSGGSSNNNSNSNSSNNNSDNNKRAAINVNNNDSSNNNNVLKTPSSDNIQKNTVRASEVRRGKLGTIQPEAPQSRVNFLGFDKLQEIMSTYFSSKSTSGWVTIGYIDDTTLDIQDYGEGGVEDLLDSLANNQVQYSLLRLTYQSHDNIQKARDVFIYWTGPNVSIVQRGKKKTHVGSLQQILTPFHADLLAYNKDNFTKEVILERSDPLSGSHVIE